MQFTRWQIVKALTVVGIVGIVSLALAYFIPTPPSKVVMATAFKGASFEYYGHQYQEIFARAHVELELRETAGAVENLKLLQDPNSDVQIAFVTGGLSDAKHAPGVLSLGTVYDQPFWIFYPSNEQLDQLSQLKGKRIAVGPVGSATRHTAEQVLGKGGVNSQTATLLPFAGSAADKALRDGQVDAVWIIGVPEATAVQSFLR
ncbi:MAG TPA: TAXI family TRAP transporter solute-binding subunit, partial [Terriglobales bacterium]|nr:TAXI family TRAP transporter solute-binding subunit [Terriglobales bacterium]